MKKGMRQISEKGQRVPGCLFYVFFCLFLISKVLLLPNFTDSILPYMDTARGVILVLALLLGFICLILLFNPPHPDRGTAAIEVLLVLFFMVFSFLVLKTEKQYYAVIKLCLLISALGRNIRSMMKCMLAVYAAVLVVSMAGYPPGITAGAVKTEAYGTGFSFGMVHPNTFAIVVVVILLLIFCLYLQDQKPGYIFLLFWTAAVPVFVIAKCRTAAFLLILFPVVALLIPLLRREKQGAGRKLLCAVLVAAPFLCWLLTFALAGQMEFLERVMSGTPFYNMFVRFIQAGAALRLYGFSAFPQSILCDGSLSVELSGWNVYLLYLDNAYAYYSMVWGLLVMGAGLCWMAAANGKCVKEKEYGLLAAALFLCIYGLMERIPLQLEYNFLLFYPLAAGAGSRTEP